ncbi:MAG: M56 family metallopeptidase, partial [bacterium]
MSAVLDTILAAIPATILDTILDTAAEPAMHALVHFLWQGSVVAMALGIVLLSLRRRSAAARYQCACWALAVMVVLPFATAVRYEWNASRAETPATLAGPAGEPATAGRVGTDAAVLAPAATLQPRDTSSAIKELARSTQQTATEATSGIAGALLRQLAWNPQQTDTARWVLGFWLAGVCLLSILHLGGWFRVQRLRNSHVEPVPAAWQERADTFCRKLGIRRAVRLLRSAAVDGPLVIGYLKPVVLIPASAVTGLPTRQLECILAHELAHIWRRDYLVNILQIVAETLLFFHPAVWWVSRQIRAERENCCDDIAVQLAGDRLAYARALVDLEELRLASPRLALGAGDGPLLRRVKRLVGGPDMSMYSSRNLLAGTLAAMLILIGGAVLALAAQERLGEVVAMAASSDEEQVTVSGGWSAERYDDELYLEIRERGDRDRRHRGQWNMTLHVDLDDFEGLTFSEDAVFSLVREAGTFRFTGDFEGPERRAEGDGRFTFAADPVFADRLGELGTRRLDDEELLVLAAQNLHVRTVRELRDLGYGPFDSDELVTIAIFEVTPEFIAEMEREGYKDLDLDTLVAMRVHDVDAEFVGNLRRAGIETDDEDDLIAWAVHDIDPEYIEDIRAQFGDNLDLDDIMAFKIHG